MFFLASSTSRRTSATPPWAERRGLRACLSRRAPAPWGGQPPLWSPAAPLPFHQALSWPSSPTLTPPRCNRSVPAGACRKRICASSLVAAAAAPAALYLCVCSVEVKLLEYLLFFNITKMYLKIYRYQSRMFWYWSHVFWYFLVLFGIFFPDTFSSHRLIWTNGRSTYFPTTLKIYRYQSRK
jgi:hypothetical protein